VEEKDWEARFKLSEKKTGTLKLFSWTALVVASLYAALVTWSLIGAWHDTDPEGATAGWIVFGFPWIFLLGRHYWFVPLNVLTVYLAVLLGLAVFRKMLRLENAEVTMFQDREPSIFPHPASAWWVPVLLAVGWLPLSIPDLFRDPYAVKNGITKGMGFAMAWGMGVAFPCSCLAAVSSIIQIFRFLMYLLNRAKPPG
jgi:hypothetical protein